MTQLQIRESSRNWWQRRLLTDNEQCDSPKHLMCERAASTLLIDDA